MAESHRIAIKAEMEKIIERINKAPDGSIRFITRNNSIQYYLRTNPKDKSGRYLRKNENEKIAIYLQKAYDEKILKILESEYSALDKLLTRTYEISEKIKKSYSTLPEMVKSQVVSIDMSDQEFADNWQSEIYIGKGMPKEKKIFCTDRNEYVRSKSELTIANALNKKNIPYKYECPLKLKNGRIIHPDFTVLNVRERKIYYWEHRGMMDSEDYADGAVKRNKEYMKSGIYPGRNLILTEETLDNPLGTLEIYGVIQEYLV